MLLDVLEDIQKQTGMHFAEEGVFEALSLRRMMFLMPEQYQTAV